MAENSNSKVVSTSLRAGPELTVGFNQNTYGSLGLQVAADMRLASVACIGVRVEFGGGLSNLRWNLEGNKEDHYSPMGFQKLGGGINAGLCFRRLIFQASVEILNHSFSGQLNDVGINHGDLEATGYHLPVGLELAIAIREMFGGNYAWLTLRGAAGPTFLNSVNRIIPPGSQAIPFPIDSMINTGFGSGGLQWIVGGSLLFGNPFDIYPKKKEEPAAEPSPVQDSKNGAKDPGKPTVERKEAPPPPSPPRRKKVPEAWKEVGQIPCNEDGLNYFKTRIEETIKTYEKICQKGGKRIADLALNGSQQDVDNGIINRLGYLQRAFDPFINRCSSFVNSKQTPLFTEITEQRIRLVEYVNKKCEVDHQQAVRDLTQPSPSRIAQRIDKVLRGIERYKQRSDLFNKEITAKAEELARLRKELSKIGITGTTHGDILARILEISENQFRLQNWIAEHPKIPNLPDSFLLDQFFNFIKDQAKREIASELGITPTQLDQRIAAEEELLKNPRLRQLLDKRGKEFIAEIAKLEKARVKPIYEKTERIGDREVATKYFKNPYADLIDQLLIDRFKLLGLQADRPSLLLSENNPNELIKRFKDDPTIKKIEELSKLSYPIAVPRGYTVDRDQKYGLSLTEKAILTTAGLIPGGAPFALLGTAAELTSALLRDQYLLGGRTTPQSLRDSFFSTTTSALSNVGPVGSFLATAVALENVRSILFNQKTLTGQPVSRNDALLEGAITTLSSLLGLKTNAQEIAEITKTLRDPSKRNNRSTSEENFLEDVLVKMRNKGATLPIGGAAEAQEALALLDGTLPKEAAKALSKIGKAAKILQQSPPGTRGSTPSTLPISRDIPGRIAAFTKYAKEHADPRMFAEEEGKRAPKILPNVPGQSKPFGIGDRSTRTPPDQRRATYVKPIDDFSKVSPPGIDPQSPEGKHLKESIDLLTSKRAPGQIRILHKPGTEGGSDTNPYQVIGKGGMGTVLKGEFIPDQPGAKPIPAAVKIYDKSELLGVLPADPLKRQFSPRTLELEEARNLARYGEQNIGPGYLGIIDAGDGKIGIVMKEVVNGIPEEKLTYKRVLEAVKKQLPGASPEKQHEAVQGVFEKVGAQYKKQVESLIDQGVQFTDSQGLVNIDDIKNPTYTLVDLASADKVTNPERLKQSYDGVIAELVRRGSGKKKLWEGSRVTDTVRLPGNVQELWLPNRDITKAQLPPSQTETLMDITKRLGTQIIGSPDKVRVSQLPTGELIVVRTDPIGNVTGDAIIIKTDGKVL